MKIHFKGYFILIPFFIFVSVAHADVTIEPYGLFEDLDGISTHANLTEDQRTHGYSQLFNRLVECEFSEKCYLQMIIDIETLMKTDPNPMYRRFLTVLKRIEPTLKEKAEVCDLPEKKEVRKIWMSCVKKYFKGYSHAGKISNSELEKMEDDIALCHDVGLIDLAKNGNIFAQAAMVNSYSDANDKKDTDIWYKLMMKKVGTPAYKQYMNCPDLP